MFSNAKNWNELMNQVKIERETRRNNYNTNKLNMDLYLLEIENINYDKINEKETTTFDREMKLDLLKALLIEWKKKYATDVHGVDYDPLIILGELIIALYSDSL